jgi:hypothetical protein
MADGVVAFLKARLDEDEKAAKAAQAPSPWRAAVHESDTWIVTDATGEPLIYDEGTPSLEEAAHIARHDPARVLREVMVLRAVVDEMARTVNGEFIDEGERVIAAGVLRDLAAIWSDPPPGWVPLITAENDFASDLGNDVPCA